MLFSHSAKTWKWKYGNRTDCKPLLQFEQSSIWKASSSFARAEAAWKQDGKKTDVHSKTPVQRNLSSLILAEQNHSEDFFATYHVLCFHFLSTLFSAICCHDSCWYEKPKYGWLVQIKLFHNGWFLVPIPYVQRLWLFGFKGREAKISMAWLHRAKDPPPSKPDLQVLRCQRAEPVDKNPWKIPWGDCMNGWFFQWKM